MPIGASSADFFHYLDFSWLYSKSKWLKIVSNFQQNHRRKTYSNVQKGWKNHGYSCAGWLAESYFLHRSARAPINNWGLPLHTCIAPSFLGQLTQWISPLKNRLGIIHDVGIIKDYAMLWKTTPKEITSILELQLIVK